jgi:hypothetical protein
MTMTHHSELTEVDGLPFDENWGSFNTYSDLRGTKAIVVEWRTGRTVKSFSGESALVDADRWAYDLHVAHDWR